jgi:hypothetical protein
MGKLKIPIHEAPILLLHKNIEVGATKCEVGPNFNVFMKLS